MWGCKVRGSKISHTQKDALLSFMVRHPEVSNDRITCDNHIKKQIWMDISSCLNGLGGTPKSPDKWQKVWQDWRYNTKKKAKDISEGNMDKTLSPAEIKLLSIVAHDGPSDAQNNSTTANQTIDHQQTDTMNFNLSEIDSGGYVNNDLNQAPHITRAQQEVLLNFLEIHPEISNDRIAFITDYTIKKQLWLEVAAILNKKCFANPKSAEKWLKLWQRWRYNTKRKACQVSADSEHKIKFSKSEERLLSIIDWKPIDFSYIQTDNQINDQNSMDFSNSLDGSQIDIFDNESNNYNNTNNVETLLTDDTKFETTDIKIEIMDDEEIDDKISENQYFTQDEEQNHPQEQNTTETTDKNNETIIKTVDNIPRTIKQQPTRNRKRFRIRNRSSMNDMRTISFYMKKSMDSVRDMCKLQVQTANRVASALEQNVTAIQSLAECQMRQAEALERQVSLDESRNAILKLMVTNLTNLVNK